MSQTNPQADLEKQLNEILANFWRLDPQVIRKMLIALIERKLLEANRNGFYAAMGMCGAKHDSVARYFEMYQEALKDPTKIEEAVKRTLKKDKSKDYHPEASASILNDAAQAKLNEAIDNIESFKPIKGEV